MSAQEEAAKPGLSSRYSFRVQGLDCAEEVAVLRREVGPLVGGEGIAMNRFRVAKGSEAAFEHVWLSRDSHLDKVPGFVEFHLLRRSCL